MTVALSQYNHLTTSFLDDRYLAYNSLSGAFHVLDERGLADAQHLFDAVADTGTAPPELTEIQTTLIADGFVIAEDFDEVAVVHRRYDERRETTGMSLTVTPTMGCNFGCGYCFQSHTNKRIGPEDVEHLKHFVSERLEPNTYLAITWFGGEPLTAFNVIEQLLPALAELAAERNCNFSHSIITNGYLLDEKKAEFLASFPEFGYAQITIDGSPYHHNQRRITLANTPTFDRIIENIKIASKHLSVMVRVNVDRRNVDSLDELLTILEEEGLRDRVSVYLGHVWEYTDEVEESSFLTKEQFASVDAQFRFMLFRRGFFSGARLPKPRQGNLCVADNPNGYVIAPDGLIFNCWNEAHLGADEAAARYDGGDVVNNQRDALDQTTWDEYEPFTHNPCSTCAVAPLCMSGCPWESMKGGEFDTGFCTPLRFNLADQLRIYHLESATKHALREQLLPVAADACEVPAMT